MNFKKITSRLILIPLISSLFSISTVLASETTFPIKQKFIVTAYYSPLPDQNHYFRGDYNSEIKLNGRGTNGASGKEVFEGMLAAPSSYEFGTKVMISGLGIGAVYDRGGSIKKANGKNRKYDRLDVWMGKGEEGLKRALAWGVRIVDGEILGTDSAIKETLDFDNLNLADITAYKTNYGSRTFKEDVYFKSKGEDVKKLQEVLKDLGYFDQEITGYYGESTRDSVIQMQIEYGIIQEEDDFGAGHFGINSRILIDKLLDGSGEKKNIYAPEIKEFNDLKENISFYTRPLKDKEKSDYVRRVQQELVNLNYLKIEPTGYYGDTTKHALTKLQQSLDLISDENDKAAGYFGPSTRAFFNKILTDRLEIKRSIAIQRKNLVKNPSLVSLKNN